MNKKLIFFDIDGTLYNENKEIPNSTIKAIEQLKENGHIVAIATGRAPYMFKNVVKETNIHTFVSLNGQIVVYEGEIIEKHALDKQELTELVKLASRNNHPLVFFGEQEVYANVKEHKDINESLSTLKMEHPKYHNAYYLNHPVYQALVFHTEEENDLYNDKFNSFKFYRWHPVSRDVVPKNRSKAVGIKSLSKRLGFDMKDVVAFGDGPNDIEMITEVGLGVAMGNGVNTVKQICDFETKDVNDDGIYYACVKLGLIKEEGDK